MSRRNARLQGLHGKSQGRSPPLPLVDNIALPAFDQHGRSPHTGAKRRWGYCKPVNRVSPK
jgi:hypothetical protein